MALFGYDRFHPALCQPISTHRRAERHCGHDYQPSDLGKKFHQRNPRRFSANGLVDNLHFDTPAKPIVSALVEYVETLIRKLKMLSDSLLKLGPEAQASEFVTR
jgi:hypothetical protein